MSSQDSEGESYVADLIAKPKSYGDERHYSWTPRKMKMKSHFFNLGTCMWSSKSQASPIQQRNLRLSLSLFVSCRRTNKNYAKGTKPWAGDRGPKEAEFCPQAQIKEEAHIINNSFITTSEEGNINTWVWALPLATAKLGGVPRYRITITFIFTFFLVRSFW